jgi:hypothetical protein
MSIRNEMRAAQFTHKAGKEPPTSKPDRDTAHQQTFQRFAQLNEPLTNDDKKKCQYPT